MNRDKRVELIKTIQNKRNSKIISLVTSDRINLSAPIHQMMNDIMYEQIRIIKERNEEFENIDLFIFSRGGDADAPWSIVSTIRECFPEKKFNVLIPFRAHSAATMISLGADELIMTNKAELGPVDITISNSPLNPMHQNNITSIDISVEDVMGYIGLLEKINCDNQNDKLVAFQLLSQHIHPLAIGKVNRLLEQTKLVANRMLSNRKEKLSEAENNDIVRKLGSEIYSHRHSISRTEARQIGISFVKNAEDYDIHEDLWSLYKLYEESLMLNDIFNPEVYLNDNNLDNFKWEELKKGIIETEYTCYTQTCDAEVRKVKMFNQPININPTINLNAVPTDQSQEIIAEWLNQNVPVLLNKATDDVLKELLKHYPSSGIELNIIDKLWNK